MGARWITVLAVVVASSACDRPRPQAAPAEPAPAASASATLAQRDASAPGDAEAPNTSCDLTWGFHGKVAGADAFLRLVREGARLRGRYLYTRVGVDIELEGTLSESGTLTLDEGPADKPTGHWEGRCDPTSRTLSGAWSAHGKHGKRATFRFDPVDNHAKPLVVVKKTRVSTHVKATADAGARTCLYEQSVAEIFGAGSPEIEQKLNLQPATMLEPRILAGSLESAASNCEETIVGARFASISLLPHGLARFEAGGYSTYETAAHPNNYEDCEDRTYDLATGDEITWESLFVTPPDDLVAKCVHAYEKRVGIDDLSSNFQYHQLDLTPLGVHLQGAGYIHAYGGLTGAGPTLPWSVLVRSGGLNASSPAKRYWQSIKPARDGSADCLFDDAK